MTENGFPCRDVVSASPCNQLRSLCLSSRFVGVHHRRRWQSAPRKLREHRVAEVNTFQRIRFNQLFFSGGGIEEFQTNEIDSAPFICLEVDSFPSFVITNWSTRLKTLQL